jgi:muconolactone delta-isomerase
MRILALEQDVPGVTADRFTPALKMAEARRVWQLQQADVIRAIYFRADAPSAVLLMECADADEARDVLATLPLVEAGLIAFEVIPLVAYPGLARLFAESDA